MALPTRLPETAARADAPASCTHCGIPVPPERDDGFCCRGCRAAHALLTETGLERFYELRCVDGVPLGDGARAMDTGLRPELEALLVRAREMTRDAEGTVRLTVTIQGIHCAACVWAIEKLFRRCDGALAIELNSTLGRADLVFREPAFDAAACFSDIEALGYGVAPPSTRPAQPADGLLARFGVAVAVAMNTMILAFAGYFGLDAGDDADLHRLFLWVSAALGAVSVAVGAPVFLRGAAQALRRGAVHLDLPIAIGILATYAGSLASVVFGDGEAAYFDTLTVFVALMLLGRLLQARVIAHHRNRLHADPGLDGLVVRRLNHDDQVTLVPARDLAPGDRLVLAPGEVLPVDARLVDAPAALSLAWISGESEPRRFNPGARLPAGAHLGGPRAVRVDALTTLADSPLVGLLDRRAPDGDPSTSPTASDDATEQNTPWWDRVSRGYVVGVLGVSALGAGAWLVAGAGVATALEVAIATLVVACPCAIGLAGPLALQLALVRLRRDHLFVRRAPFVDRLGRVTDVLFDKTGTLTRGRPEVANAEALDAMPADARAALAQMTSRSDHPKSRALYDALASRSAGGRALATFDASCEVEEIPGEGLVLRHPDGPTWRLGAAPASARAGLGAGAVALHRDNVVVAAFGFGESLHAHARDEIRALEEAGLRIHLLSGDHPARAAAVGATLGLDPARVRGGMKPEEKAAYVRSLDPTQSTTLMIGDGLNDAPAFEAAACAGTPAVDSPALPSRADFYFLGAGVVPVRHLVDVARHTTRVRSRLLWVAVAYNVGAVAFALAGWVTPLVAAALMPVSSLTTVALAVRGMGRLPSLTDDATSSAPRTSATDSGEPRTLGAPPATTLEAAA